MLVTWLLLLFACARCLIIRWTGIAILLTFTNGFRAITSKGRGLALAVIVRMCSAACCCRAASIIQVSRDACRTASALWRRTRAAAANFADLGSWVCI